MESSRKLILLKLSTLQYIPKLIWQYNISKLASISKRHSHIFHNNQLKTVINTWNLFERFSFYGLTISTSCNQLLTILPSSLSPQPSCVRNIHGDQYNNRMLTASYVHIKRGMQFSFCHNSVVYNVSLIWFAKTLKRSQFAKSTYDDHF